MVGVELGDAAVAAALPDAWCPSRSPGCSPPAGAGPRDGCRAGRTRSPGAGCRSGAGRRGRHRSRRAAARPPASRRPRPGSSSGGSTHQVWPASGPWEAAARWEPQRGRGRCPRPGSRCSPGRCPPWEPRRHQQECIVSPVSETRATAIPRHFRQNVKRPARFPVGRTDPVRSELGPPQVPLPSRCRDIHGSPAAISPITLGCRKREQRAQRVCGHQQRGKRRQQMSDCHCVNRQPSSRPRRHARESMNEQARPQNPQMS